MPHPDPKAWAAIAITLAGGALCLLAHYSRYERIRQLCQCLLLVLTAALCMLCIVVLVLEYCIH